MSQQSFRLAEQGAHFVRGSALSPHVQAQCRARYVQRYTGDHKPQWACRPYADGRSYPVHFADDAEWLAHTFFAVTLAGFLDERVKHCHSQPTWPTRPDLRPKGSYRMGADVLAA